MVGSGNFLHEPKDEFCVSRFPLSPRGTSGERGAERRTNLLSPTLSSRWGREGEDETHAYKIHGHNLQRRNIRNHVHDCRNPQVVICMSDSDAKRDRVLKEAFGCRIALVACTGAVLGNYTAAEDVAQEAMLAVVKKFDQFQEGTSMLVWCRAIVRLEVLRMKQKRQREQTLAERLLDDAINAAFDEFHTAQPHGGEKPAVKLQPDSRFRVHGRIESSQLEKQAGLENSEVELVPPSNID